ncbi:hypothetical protein MRB53_036947 [Persea americana]|nr:hypothetical protein MRB53_036947 [Persea americana]
MVTSGAIYHLLRALTIPVDIRNICVLLAPGFSGLTSTATYLLTKEVSGSPSAGLLSAIFMGIAPGYISRSVAGSYDNEAIAIFLLVFTFFLWIKALKEGSAMWGALTALFYGYMVSAWGGYVFITNLIPLHVFVLICMGRYSPRLYVSYTTWFALGTLGSMQIPFVGFLPIRSSDHMAALGTFGLIQLVAFVDFIRTQLPSKQFATLLRALVLLVVGGGFGGLVLLTVTGIIAPWSGRFYSLWDTGYAKIHIPIIASVSEHQPTAWPSFFFDLSFLIWAFPAGVYMCFRNLKDEQVFIVIYAMLASYFAGVMVRLMLTLTPVVCVAAAIAVSTILDGFLKADAPLENAPENGHADSKPSTTSIPESLKSTKVPFVGIYSFATKFTTVGAFVLYLLLFVLHCTWVTSNAYSSPSVVLASRTADGNQHIIDDYREAYYWLRQNTPDTAKVMSWWDYGYQIGGMADRPTLVDNNTWNNTHIATVGKAMSSREEVSYPIMRAHEVDYVLVVFGGLLGYSGDDINKFLWMVRISEGIWPEEIHERDYFTARGEYRVDEEATPTMKNSLMYKMSYYRYNQLFPAGQAQDRVRGARIPADNIELSTLEEAFTSENWIIRIYKVKDLDNVGRDHVFPLQSQSIEKRLQEAAGDSDFDLETCVASVTISSAEDAYNSGHGAGTLASDLNGRAGKDIEHVAIVHCLDLDLTCLEVIVHSRAGPLVACGTSPSWSKRFSKPPSLGDIASRISLVGAASKAVNLSPQHPDPVNCVLWPQVLLPIYWAPLLHCKPQPVASSPAPQSSISQRSSTAPRSRLNRWYRCNRRTSHPLDTLSRVFPLWPSKIKDLSPSESSAARCHTNIWHLSSLQKHGSSLFSQSEESNIEPGSVSSKSKVSNATASETESRVGKPEKASAKADSRREDIYVTTSRSPARGETIRVVHERDLSCTGVGEQIEPAEDASKASYESRSQLRFAYSGNGKARIRAEVVADETTEEQTPASTRASKPSDAVGNKHLLSSKADATALDETTKATKASSQKGASRPFEPSKLVEERRDQSTTTDDSAYFTPRARNHEVDLRIAAHPKPYRYRLVTVRAVQKEDSDDSFPREKSKSKENVKGQAEETKPAPRATTRLYNLGLKHLHLQVPNRLHRKHASRRVEVETSISTALPPPRPRSPPSEDSDDKTQYPRSDHRQTPSRVRFDLRPRDEYEKKRARDVEREWEEEEHDRREALRVKQRAMKTAEKGGGPFETYDGVADDRTAESLTGLCSIPLRAMIRPRKTRELDGESSVSQTQLDHDGVSSDSIPSIFSSSQHSTERVTERGGARSYRNLARQESTLSTSLSPDSKPLTQSPVKKSPELRAAQGSRSSDAVSPIALTYELKRMKPIRRVIGEPFESDDEDRADLQHKVEQWRRRVARETGQRRTKRGAVVGQWDWC